MFTSVIDSVDTADRYVGKDIRIYDHDKKLFGRGRLVGYRMNGYGLVLHFECFEVQLSKQKIDTGILGILGIGEYVYVIPR